LVLAPAFQKYADTILNAQEILIQHYTIAEKGSAINNHAFEGLHQELVRIWRQARDTAGDVTYDFVVPTKQVAAAGAIISSSKKRKFHK
jgi:hypothetical protein